MHTSDDPVTRRAFLTTGSLTLAAVGAGLAPAVAGQGRVSKEAEQLNARLVTEFCECFAKGDVAKATSLLAANCIYRPSQMSKPVIGREMVADSIKRMITERGGIDFKVLKTVTLGPIVVNERDDIPRQPRTIKGKVFEKFHVAAGVFFMIDGKIEEWTDYVFL
jgi:limonene-1,2-epoxide hydrolase